MNNVRFEGKSKSGKTFDIIISEKIDLNSYDENYISISTLYDGKEIGDVDFITVDTTPCIKLNSYQTKKIFNVDKDFSYVKIDREYKNEIKEFKEKCKEAAIMAANKEIEGFKESNESVIIVAIREGGKITAAGIQGPSYLACKILKEKIEKIFINKIITVAEMQKEPTVDGRYWIEKYTKEINYIDMLDMYQNAVKKETEITNRSKEKIEILRKKAIETGELVEIYRETDALNINKVYVTYFNGKGNEITIEEKIA